MKKDKRRSDNTHSFDINVAQIVGIEKAILLKEKIGWCEENQREGRNLINGIPFTFNSYRAYAQKFPYMKWQSIARWEVQLEQDGWLFSTTNNKRAGDKTKWYTVNFERYYDAMLLIVQNQNEVNKWIDEVRQQVSQNETGVSQNETPISQNETTLPSLTTTLTSSRSKRAKRVSPASHPQRNVMEEAATICETYFGEGYFAGLAKSEKGREFKNLQGILEKVAGRQGLTNYAADPDKCLEALEAFLQAVREMKDDWYRKNARTVAVLNSQFTNIVQKFRHERNRNNRPDDATIDREVEEYLARRASGQFA